MNAVAYDLYCQISLVFVLGTCWWLPAEIQIHISRIYGELVRMHFRNFGRTFYDIRGMITFLPMPAVRYITDVRRGKLRHAMIYGVYYYLWDQSAGFREYYRLGYTKVRGLETSTGGMPTWLWTMQYRYDISSRVEELLYYVAARYD